MRRFLRRLVEYSLSQGVGMRYGGAWRLALPIGALVVLIYSVIEGLEGQYVYKEEALIILVFCSVHFGIVLYGCIFSSGVKVEPRFELFYIMHRKNWFRWSVRSREGEVFKFRIEDLVEMLTEIVQGKARKERFCRLEGEFGDFDDDRGDHAGLPWQDKVFFEEHEKYWERKRPM